jgi:hypothetical protein
MDEREMTKQMFKMMGMRVLESGESAVFFSEVGAGLHVTTPPNGTYYSQDVVAPAGFEGMTDEELKPYADEAVREWKEFLSKMPNGMREAYGG